MNPAPPVTSRFTVREVSCIKRAKSNGPRRSIVIPTYNERDCLPAIVPAVRAAVPDADRAGRRRQLARRDRRARRRAGGRPIPRCAVLHRTGKEGLGAAYLAAFAHALAAPAGWRAHRPDGRRLLARPRRRAAPARGARRRRRPGHRLALRARAAAPRTGASAGASSAAAAASTRAPCWASELQDLTAGFKAWKAETLRGIDLRRRVGARLRLPDRDDATAPCATASASTRSRSSSSTAASASRRCRGRSSSRR